jgi:hypothetical protein
MRPTLPMEPQTSGEVWINLRGTPSMVEDTKVVETMETDDPYV